MLRSVAEQHGFRTTFMPKPYLNRTGSGAHVHVSAWGAPGTAGAGKNLFTDPAGELGLSPLAYSFIAGVLASAEGLCALTNPVVNSYKRLNARVTTSGATWSPNTVTYTGNNRTHMIRIPEGNRFEFRLPVRAPGGNSIVTRFTHVGALRRTFTHSRTPFPLGAALPTTRTAP